MADEHEMTVDERWKYLRRVQGRYWAACKPLCTASRSPTWTLIGSRLTDNLRTLPRDASVRTSSVRKGSGTNVPSARERPAGVTLRSMPRVRSEADSVPEAAVSTSSCP